MLYLEGMTSTETTKTWTRNLETSMVGFLKDDAFGTHRGGRSYHYNLRGTNGRFVKVVHVDQITVERLPLFLCEKGMTHAASNCPNARGAMVLETTPTGSGWLCSDCVHVPVFETEHHAATSGTETCVECLVEKHVRKFPTVNVAGVGTVRGETCRDCQAERRTSSQLRTGGRPWVHA